MRYRIAQLALVVVAVASVAAASTAGTAHGVRDARPPLPRPPLAGPWYTPAELRALIAFSNLSFAGKQALMRSLHP